LKETRRSAGDHIKYTDVIEVRKNLIGLLNSIHQGDPMVNCERRREIEKLLRIKTDI